jgi:hypothetical protein
MGFMKNYEILDHYGERRIEAGKMEGTDAPDVTEDDDTHL